MKSIFTYGTLRRSERNHIVLLHTNHEFVGEDSIPARTVGMWGDIPLIVPDAEGSVPGEVFNVDEAGMRRLDNFEGVPWGMYRRATVTTSAGREVEVYFPGEDLLATRVSVSNQH